MFPLGSVVRKVSDTAARMVETENDGRGGGVRPLPIVFCFDLIESCSLTCETQNQEETQKNRQLRRLEVSESRENKEALGVDGGKGGGKREGNAKR